MKKNLFYLFALVCSMSLFIACSDDDPDYSTAIDGEIVGNYKGTLNVTVQGQLLGKDIPQKISVAKAGPAAINLSLKDFSFIVNCLRKVILTLLQGFRSWMCKLCLVL